MRRVRSMSPLIYTMHMLATTSHDVAEAFKRSLTPGATASLAMSIADIARNVEALERAVKREWRLVTEHPAEVDVSVWVCNRGRLVRLCAQINVLHAAAGRSINRVQNYVGLMADRVDSAKIVYDRFRNEITAVVSYAVDLYDKAIMAMISHFGHTTFKKESTWELVIAGQLGLRGDKQLDLTGSGA